MIDFRIKLLLILLKIGGRLLDIGAADCLLKSFLPKDIKYYSLDIKNYEKCKHNFLIDLDKEKIPGHNNFFDMVLCLDTLEHTIYPLKILEEIKRVAKKDALFIFSLPNEYNFLQRIYYFFAIKTQTEISWKVVEEHQHIHKPRIQDIKNLFVKDFKILSIIYHWESRMSSKNKFFKYIDKIINLLSKIIPNLFARDVVIVCKNKK